MLLQHLHQLQNHHSGSDGFSSRRGPRISLDLDIIHSGDLVMCRMRLDVGSQPAQHVVDNFLRGTDESQTVRSTERDGHPCTRFGSGILISKDERIEIHLLLRNIGVESHDPTGIEQILEQLLHQLSSEDGFVGMSTPWVPLDFNLMRTVIVADVLDSSLPMLIDGVLDERLDLRWEL